MNSSPALTRRSLLCLLAAAPILASLPGCTRSTGLQGSFLQLWKSHADLKPEQWRQRLAAMADMGCQTVTLQWVGLIGGDSPWMIPEGMLRTLFDIAYEEGMQVQVGLPFDNAWWQALSADEQGQKRFFEKALGDAQRYMASAPWPQHRAFDGWYIPYELEQYHWASADSQQRLAQWLAAMASSTRQHSDRVPSISTYYSVLPTEGSLLQLWRTLLDVTQLRPVVQDGVGVAGWANLQAIEPLLLELRRRQVPFDVVVELFEQLPSQHNDGSDFTARSADYARVRRQLEWARTTGAQHVVAFALDPWALGDDPRARRLHEDWLRGRG
ncbi:DUF4434 domain-containing protein [Pseudomonas putida]|mgnify:CR=1 FL=1|uniref:DUF4434 domain-containing protein n=1 Tax=Pseudomonas putida TaxID=303 RepID=UPI000DAFF7F7|nr:DUF4434 domain-containing protein [Pseudomonas putida]MBI6940563.1 DUF4434 domain-containing protein [Pseudomonas putida]MBI6956761.1 DUF4434 domain-containing protein [Pseudomonas putida]PZQ40688.1 MAG: DUF4434 domain-containing protein [Pseudomonas putida]